MIDPDYKMTGPEEVTVIFQGTTPGVRSQGERFILRHQGEHIWAISHLKDFPKGPVNCGHIHGLENAIDELWERVKRPTYERVNNE